MLAFRPQAAAAEFGDDVARIATGMTMDEHLAAFALADRQRGVLVVMRGAFRDPAAGRFFAAERAGDVGCGDVDHRGDLQSGA